MEEIVVQMRNHNVTAYDLTEFDKDWVNPATRKDIENVARQYNYEVFGPPWIKIRGRKLIGVKNFGVDHIFKNSDETKVDAIIAYYEANKEQNWSIQLVTETVNKLFKLSLYDCIWQ